MKQQPVVGWNSQVIDRRCWFLRWLSWRWSGAVVLDQVQTVLGWDLSGEGDGVAFSFTSPAHLSQTAGSGAPSTRSTPQMSDVISKVWRYV